jgi:hypothetical protein
MHGWCEKKHTRFSIAISRDLSLTETEWVLIHEWAHMLDWRPHHPLIHTHGPTWGVMYATIWQRYHDTL